MLESSQDLLYIVLALCVLWFTVFLCWLLYQAARVLKHANEVIEHLLEKLELLTDAVHFIQDKVDGVSKHMGVVSGMVATVVEKFVVGRIRDSVEKRRESPRKKKKEGLSMGEDVQ